MPEDQADFGFEETKSTILDFFLMFEEAKWVVTTTMGVSIVIFLIMIGMADVVGKIIGGSPEQNLPGLFVLGVVTILVLCIWLPIANGRLFLKIIIKGRKQQRELLAIQSHLMRKSYLMNFELVEPEIIVQEGNPKLEKMMNHLSFVFPDIDRINKKRIKKAKSAEQYGKRFKRKLHFLRKYDLGIKTAIGWYVVQFYDNVVTFDDVQKIARNFSLEKSRGAQVQRVIVVGKEFDGSFEKEMLTEKMGSLKRKIHVDVILEDEHGYSTVWID